LGVKKACIFNISKIFQIHIGEQLNYVVIEERFNMTTEKYALITGASSGLGKAFARELALRNTNLILVSLPGEGLAEFAQELRDTCVEVVYYEIDLAQTNQIEWLAEDVNSKYNLFLLINNAGRGGTNRIMDVKTDYINSIIQLNVTATALLTHALLPNLLNQNQAYVLNVSSMAAFSPMGFKTVYPASKSFVHYFSRGLYQELRYSPVFVSVLTPGPMKTNADVSQRIERQGIFGRIGLISPERVAKKAIDQLYKRDTLILLGFWNGLNWLLMKTIPIGLRLPLLTRLVKREIRATEQATC